MDVILGLRRLSILKAALTRSGNTYLLIISAYYAMEEYKVSALNHFFAEKGLKYSIGSSSCNPYKLIIINNIPIYARLANTPQLTEQGLMGVEKLGSNEGCLLCFGREVPASLWMKNCKINLQAATINSKGEIVDILDMYYKDPYVSHRASSPVIYVLEMPEGFFTKNNVKVGDRVRI